MGKKLKTPEPKIEKQERPKRLYFNNKKSVLASSVEEANSLLSK